MEVVLARLDVEDVVRCKSVCKSWYNLISSNDFVKAHLKHSYISNREHGFLRIRLHWIPNNNAANLRNCLMVGSCNGLVCISPNPGEFLVTNPSTREVKNLPNLGYNDNRRKVCCWGFGYDYTNDDYKVVVGFSESKDHVGFQVLSLISDKWIFDGDCHYLTYNTNANPDASANDLLCGILYDGALHWFMDDTKKKKSVILSFDLSLEKFKEIPQPDDDVYLCDNRTLLVTFEEHLCIVRSYYIHDRYYRYCQTIWVMRNYNCWQMLPHDYNGDMYAITAYTLDCFPDNTWRLCDYQKLNICYSITSPIFVKSLVSPYPCVD
ncbi:F-box/kelch-repeat protein At3g06240-like [Rutidosis leptorrhynchoides]|uniref:F-box/kelch-repeat protein At3g06240-like n=1 Tax=Rutidosis leptorrhynchoides TaxID=125765 RepID=UPI003A994FD9